MLESLVNPKKVDKGPIKMFFIGLVYASLSILLVSWFFSGDPILSKYSGILVVTFSVMFAFPFMFYLIQKEESDDEGVSGFLGVLKIHSDALYAFMWLFFGFIIAFSFWEIVLQNQMLFNVQIQAYCAINSPDNVQSCVSQYSSITGLTGNVTNGSKLLSVISNNIYVMIFTLIFSLIFGAGAIFILAWNASVIAAAIGIFAKYNLSYIPLGILRYMIHGVPEISAYFVTALAGGIFGVGIARNGIRNEKFLRVLQNVFLLLFIALILLIIGALIEVYITPILF